MKSKDIETGSVIIEQNTGLEWGGSKKPPFWIFKMLGLDNKNETPSSMSKCLINLRKSIHKSFK